MAKGNELVPAEKTVHASPLLKPHQETIMAYIREVRAEYPDARIVLHTSVDQARQKIVVEILVELDEDAQPIAPESKPESKLSALMKGIKDAAMEVVVTFKKTQTKTQETPKIFKHFHEAFDYVRTRTGKPCKVRAWTYYKKQKVFATFTIMRFWDEQKHSTYKVDIAFDNPALQKVVPLLKGDRGPGLYSLPQLQHLVAEWETI